jgi:hypothetical protein
MSAATRSAVFWAWTARWAFSSRQTCHGPGKYVERLRHGLEEPAVVGDDHAGRVERRELALEPLEARHVEMVRRLVEQDQVGIAGQRSGERGAGDLPAREGGELPVEVLVVEAEAPCDRSDVVAPPVAAGVLEPRLRARVGGKRRRVVAPRRHRLLEAGELPLGGRQVGGAREDVLAQGQVAVERRALVVERDARSLLDHELATLDRRLAHEHAQERRLAGAVRAGEREPVAAFELERDPVEEEAARELLPQVGSDDDRHAAMVARRAAPLHGSGVTWVGSAP